MECLFSFHHLAWILDTVTFILIFSITIHNQNTIQRTDKMLFYYPKYTYILKESSSNYRGLIVISITMPADVKRRQIQINKSNFDNMIKVSDHRYLYITDIDDIQNSTLIKPYYHEYHKHIVPITQVKLKADINRAIKRVSAVKYFLENTTNSFAWICTDDVFFDSSKFDFLVSELSSKYKTEKDPMLLGYPVRTPQVIFLQGGCGWIISRRTARDILKVADNWISHISKEDDVETERLLNLIGYDFENTTCPYMSGHDVYPFYKKKTRVPICPKSNKASQQSSYSKSTTKEHNLSPIQSYIALHPNKAYLDISYQAFDRILSIKKQADSHKYFTYNFQNHMYVCRKE
ncbi:hypothetical protein TRFO_42139 [Tritrichomonas foetus]|uniref:Uncharacterized protein n=1 Tax=Tritrichomonas foetus TaxID=1144522 RepID=A0A1J4KXM8_9EUKA|nr:hypothetical protein TRFO_42139 [Tritrichomonas foetus]|eukprot:OHT15991.1 hypothetical protein TRFO_42139 [Tritrichomonas foetus]